MPKTARKKPRGEQKVLSGGRKRVLVVLFVPSVERDGTTPIDQQRWVDAAQRTPRPRVSGATTSEEAHS